MNLINKLILLFFLLASHIMCGQDTLGDIHIGDEVIIELQKGSTLQGKVLGKSIHTVTIENKALDNPTVNIKDIKSIEPIRSDKYFFDNPAPNKKFISETAFGLKKGEFQYQNILLGINSFSYGFSDHFTLSGGLETFSLLIGGNFPILFISPKISTRISKEVHIAGGANLLVIPEDGFDSGREIGGTVYGVTTFGNVNNNLTVGLGYGFSGEEFFDTPIFQIGGMTRVSKSIMLVADNFLVSSDGNLVGGGIFSVRYISKKIAIDIGFATDFEEGAFPVVGLVIK